MNMTEYQLHQLEEDLEKLSTKQLQRIIQLAQNLIQQTTITKKVHFNNDLTSDQIDRILISEKIDPQRDIKINDTISNNTRTITFEIRN